MVHDDDGAGNNDLFLKLGFGSLYLKQSHTLIRDSWAILWLSRIY
jgi:hypothetical protein